jgi:hypothetical protein
MKMAKSKRKTSRAERVKREVESLAPVSKLTPAQLIHFCNELGLDLFDAEFRQRIAEIKKTPAAYRDLVKELTAKRVEFVEDRLRLGLSMWTRVAAVAARVLDDAYVPAKFSSSSRLEYRWRLSEGISVPKAVRDDAELQWAKVFGHDAGVITKSDLEAKLSGYGTPKSKAPALKRDWPFSTLGGMRRAFRAFGCPARLLGGDITTFALSVLLHLHGKWRKTQAAKHSKHHRQNREQPKKYADAKSQKTDAKAQQPDAKNLEPYDKILPEGG